MIDLAVLKQAVGELDEDKALELLNEFIKSSPNETDTLSVVTACQQGMDIVGTKYEEGEYFVGDLIFAGELLTSCIDTVKPYIGSLDSGTRGTIVLGTVQGDIHDIGKNIFKSMSEAAGFKVIDLGIDQPVENFVNAVKEHNAQIVGMSGVLTLSIDSMKRTIEALKNEGLQVKVAIGGNAVSADTCDYVGADTWSKNAAEAVKIFGEWVS